MDKYLDLAQKNMTAPNIVVLQVWDLYMSSRSSAGKRFGEGIAGKGLGFDHGPQVTVVDAAGKTQIISLPRLTEAASKPLWQKLIAQVRERMKKRGLDKSLMFGMFTDAAPTKEDIQFFKDLAPDVPWVQQGHGLFEEGQKIHGIADLGYQATVWGAKFCDSVPTHGTTDNDNLHGWRRRLLAADFERNTGLDDYPSTRWRHWAETCITGNMRHFLSILYFSVTFMVPICSPVSSSTRRTSWPLLMESARACLADKVTGMGQKVPSLSVIWSLQEPFQSASPMKPSRGVKPPMPIMMRSAVSRELIGTTVKSLARFFSSAISAAESISGFSFFLYHADLQEPSIFLLGGLGH